ncbi:MAG: trans-4-hydroxy-L-proline dehydratase activase [Peptostreptococcaceae bacterium]
MKNTLVINIQKCSIHDGPGIRTTVFFKGCPLNCIWCHNPESKSYNKDVLYNEEKCTKCESCIKCCPENAIYSYNNNVCLDRTKCSHCETCLDYCLNNAREVVGKEYRIKDLVKEIEKDRIFYEESGGGVTLSGGEVMTQNIDYIERLVKILYEKGISVAIDTCGYAKYENYEKILPYVEVFLYDIKLINDERHILFTDKSNKLILENLVKLSDKNANINIRIPLIDGINVDKNNDEVKEIINFIKQLNIKKVNLLPYHNIGMYKYKKLDMQYNEIKMDRPSDKKLEEIKKLFEAENFDTSIGG